MEVLPSQVILRNSTVGNVESSTSCDRPWMERHTSKMIYRPNDTNGCSIKCDYSVLFDPSSVSIFHSNMALAAKLLISFSSASLIIYILTFGSNIRRQLRECSCALSFTFLLLGVIVHLNLEYKINWHCRNSFLCPLSTFLFIFSFLSCSILYLFFTSNIIIELRSFFSSLSLHPKQIDKLPYRWAHLISWCVIFILSAILTTIALPDYSNNPVSGTNLEPWPVIKICFFTQEWPIYIVTICHVIFLSLSIGCIICCLYYITTLLPLLGYLSPNGKWNIRIYAVRLSSLLVCLLFHLGAVLFAISSFKSKKAQSLENLIKCDESEECSRETDLSSLLYVVYSLEFCSFVQGLWPLDASTVRYLLSQIIKPDDEVDKFNRIPDVYAKRNSGKKTGSVILNRSSNNHPSTSDNSTVEQWLYSNRLINRRAAAIPTKLIPDLKQSDTPVFRKRKCTKKKHKTWSVKEGFTQHHQRTLYRRSSGSETDEVDNWQLQFSNYSISHEEYLTAAIDKINQMGFSTSVSEPSDQKSDPFSENHSYSYLNQVHLSDLTSDDEY